MNLSSKNIKEIKTTFAGVLLISLSILDLWKFKNLTAEFWGMPIQVAGILIGLVLLVMPDTVLTFTKKKLE